MAAVCPDPDCPNAALRRRFEAAVNALAMTGVVLLSLAGVAGVGLIVYYLWTHDPMTAGAATATGLAFTGAVALHRWVRRRRGR